MFPADVRKKNLKKLVLSLRNNPNFLGSAITMPYKTAIIKYIDEIARFGRVHAIALEGQKWIGSADPDWEGTTEYFPTNED